MHVTNQLELAVELGQNPHAWVRVRTRWGTHYWLCRRCAPETPLTFEGDVHVLAPTVDDTVCEGWNDGWVCGLRA